MLVGPNGIYTNDNTNAILNYLEHYKLILEHWNAQYQGGYINLNWLGSVGCKMIYIDMDFLL